MTDLTVIGIEFQTAPTLSVIGIEILNCADDTTFGIYFRICTEICIESCAGKSVTRQKDLDFRFLFSLNSKFPLYYRQCGFVKKIQLLLLMGPSEIP